MTQSLLRQFAVMWDCYGLEAVQQVPHASEHTFALLANKPKPVYPNIEMWALRARFNSQRHYEIYIVSAEPEFTEQHIRDMFEADPQTAADTIRRYGHQYWSDRELKSRVIT